MMNLGEHFQTDRQALAQTLAEAVAGHLRGAIEARGRASLVVSGGSTPQPFFEALRKIDLAWSEVRVTLADERWVEPSDPASNEAFVRRHLLQERAAAATFVGLKTPGATPEEGCEECEARLRAIARPFDVVILGMGQDGHTASLFPEAEALPAGLDPEAPNLCLAVHPPAAPHARMSLSLAALLASEFCALHITGEAKRKTLERALGPRPEEPIPIRTLLRQAAAQEKCVEVYWAP